MIKKEIGGDSSSETHAVQYELYFLVIRFTFWAILELKEVGLFEFQI